jgi:hypothetical protein
VGVFSKVLLAIAILVANGVLLFVILRFLLWLAFPGKRDEEAAVAAARPAAGAAAAAKGGKAATVAAAAAVTTQLHEPGPPTPTPGMPVLATTAAVGRPRAYPHRLLIGFPVILALFAGGVWLGSVVGGSGSASAATRTIHVTGKVITVDKTTEVRVPAQKVVVKGSVISVPAATVRLPAHVVTHVVRRTTTLTLPGKTVTTATTVAIPTTITEPGTDTTITMTVTDTVTSGTSTTSTSATT